MALQAVVSKNFNFFQQCHRGPSSLAVTNRFWSIQIDLDGHMGLYMSHVQFYVSWLILHGSFPNCLWMVSIIIIADLYKLGGPLAASKAIFDDFPCIIPRFSFAISGGSWELIYLLKMYNNIVHLLLKIWLEK